MPEAALYASTKFLSACPYKLSLKSNISLFAISLSFGGSKLL
jgi:hypothetical protein